MPPVYLSELGSERESSKQVELLHDDVRRNNARLNAYTLGA